MIEAGADAIVGVSRLEATHPAFAVRRSKDGAITPYASASFAQMPRRQDIEPLFVLDGTLYISSVEGLRREQSFCHGRTLGYESARYKAQEIDDLVDFICVEAVATHRDMLEQLDRASPPEVE